MDGCSVDVVITGEGNSVEQLLGRVISIISRRKWL